MQCARPVGAAIARHIEAAIAAGRPQRSLCRNPYDVAVAWIERDDADVLRVRQPNAPPRVTAVGALVDAIAEPDAPLTRVLAGPQPDRARVARIDLDNADGIRTGIVEDRAPRGACVRRLEHAA